MPARFSSPAFGGDRSSGRGAAAPIATVSLLLVFAAVFALECHVAAVGAGTSIDTGTLLALGAVNRAPVAAGDLHRLFCAPFLHGSLAHLVGNGVALLLVGTALERVIGPAALFCVFAGGGVAGAIGSVLLDPPSVVSCGASGGITALLMAVLIGSLAVRDDRSRLRLAGRSIAIVALTLRTPAHATVAVDHAAHFGGALFGAACGLLLLWRERLDLDWKGAEELAAAVAACAVVLSFCAASWRYPALRVAAALIPAAELPRDDAAVAATAPVLLGRYPADPRAHLFAADLALRRNDADGVERELRTALALASGERALFEPSFVNRIRGTLGAVLAARGRLAEGRAIAGPSCAATGAQAPPPSVRRAMERELVCPGA